MTPGQKRLAEIARLETARVYGSMCPEHRQPEPAAEPRVFERPDDSYYGPAPAEVLTELVGALTAEAPSRELRPAERRSVEQAIARGLDDDRIAALLHLDTAAVRTVRAALDRLSA